MDKKQQKLWNACHARDEAKVLSLLKEGVDPRCADESGITPLMIANGSGLASGALSALASRSDLLARSHDGSTVMHWAAKRQEPLALEWVKEHVELALELDRDGVSPVHLAARYHWAEGLEVIFPLAAIQIKEAVVDLAKSCLSECIVHGLCEPGRIGWVNRLAKLRAVSSSLPQGSKRFGSKMIEQLEGEKGLARHLKSARIEHERFDVVLKTLWPAMTESMWFDVIDNISTTHVRIQEAKTRARSFAAQRCKEALGSLKTSTSGQKKRDPSI